MGYNQVFGGQNVFPAELTLLNLALTANTELAWPTEQALPGVDVFADIIEVTPDAGLSIMMPDARLATDGQATLINNVGANTVSILDNAGNNIGSVASGEVWQFYLQSNTTQAGVWRTFEFGAGTSSAVAAALAGAGLKAITTTLNVKIAPTVTNASPIVPVAGDRAEAFVWTGGVGALTLPDPAVVGSDWFIYVRNGGTGNLTATPTAGLINGAATLVFEPSFSAIVITDGTNFYTIGFPASLSSLFDFISINVAGTGTYTLAGNELNRISYRFTGVLTGNRDIEVPASIQQYWVDNQTSGAFTLTVKTAAGTGIAVQQGFARILYCDGTNVVEAEESWADTLVQGDIIYGSAAGVITRLPKDTNATRYLSNTGANNDPAWAQVNLANGVTGDLPFANITQGAALSVLGVTGAAPADLASIAGVANQVLRVDSGATALAFGALNLAAAAAVTGVLDETNGGTGQSTFAQGDMLYASAADVLSKLAKDAAGFRFLANTGASNDPAWLLPQLAGNVLDNTDSNFILSDGWRVKYHTSGSHTWTILANATVAFPVGTMIWLHNTTGDLAIAPAATVTLDGHGQNLAGAGSISIPAGYSGVLIQIAADLWMLLTDAPLTVGVDVVYSGYVDAAAAAEQVPAGWSVANTGTGLYTVTHNLGLAGANDLSVALTLIRAVADDTYINVISPGVNSFTLGIVDTGSGPVDSDFFFICKRNV